ncbi:MAG: hypothetical protein NC828_00975, partial [Candidatus Omnitrophica bacterium]|nr:hypothetical protein [Candidatus Omnitrophota bacterium]
IKKIDKKIFGKIILIYILSAWLFVLSRMKVNVVCVLILIEIILHRLSWFMLSSLSERLKIDEGCVY